MAKYRKKPVVIEAVQFFNGDGKNTIKECIVFCHGNGYFSNEDNTIEIKTMEGTMKANDSDWLIKGIKGEFYPCKPDIFEATYEKV